jgi:hypothetical protein
MWIVLCGLISLMFALYGVYAFTGNVTCKIFNSNANLKSKCAKYTWIPSAIVVAIVLGLMMFRAWSLS